MHVPLPQLLCLLRPAVFGAVILALTLGPTHRLGHGQSADEPDPTGGLRSRGMVPSAPAAGQTREELVRQWDLDGNGTIDASEAAVARARMRRTDARSALVLLCSTNNSRPPGVSQIERPGGVLMET